MIASVAGVLRSIRVWREGDPGHLSPVVHDSVPHDHQRESSTNREDSAHKYELIK